MPQETIHKAPETKNQEPSGSNLLVRAENVGKIFCRDLKKSLWYGLKDGVGELLPVLEGRKYDANGAPVLRKGEFWANQGISFELRRGECLGLIGRNGAGKTTLLKMLNGLIKPDVGRIEMRGRVAALIALGAGFNPILSGLENIYVNASVLGLTKKEIDAKKDDIIDFSEIGEFIEAPVQTYSSGMKVRLGFAVATAMNPDVLILDEVLAVGDAAFRTKCYHRINQIRKNAAVIFVSHNMNQTARICDQALALSAGKTAFLGNIVQGIQVYESLNEAETDEGEKLLTVYPPLTNFIVGCQSTVRSGAPFHLRIDWHSDDLVKDFLLRIVFVNASSENVADTTFSSKLMGHSISSGSGRWELEIPMLPLKNGRYTVSVTLVSSKGAVLAWSLRQTYFEIKDSSIHAITDIHLPAGKWCDLPQGSTTDNIQ